MSPLGEAFRNRLRNFPSIVNCCTADWFTLWPKEALISVARATLNTGDMQELLGDVLEPMVEMFGAIHLSVEEASKEFWDMLRRRNYVTPTSYLELFLSSFKSLLTFKRTEVNTKRERLQAGLDKLASTKAVVATLQKEIELLAPVLVVKSKEVEEMMVVITKDKADAEVIKAACEIEEADANEKAAATKEIADSAQADLDKALPALDKALKSLDSLKKSDIDEVKALGKPPGGVRLTMEVCCHFFKVKPEMVKDESGKKVPDFFGTSKKTILSDAKDFMQKMVNYDKDHIEQGVIDKIVPFMTDPDFTPEMIKKASVACTAICMWAHAMHDYHFVALGVAPKKAALAGAQEILDKVLASLAGAKARLSEVVAKVASLESQFDAAVKEKSELEAKAGQCQVRLVNAEKLIGGLGGEEARWTETIF